MNALLVTASMPCPMCGHSAAPEADSTCVIAWYSCHHCGHEWSARIRNGHPDPAVAEDGFSHVLLHKERP